MKSLRTSIALIGATVSAREAGGGPAETKPPQQKLRGLLFDGDGGLEGLLGAGGAGGLDSLLGALVGGGSGGSGGGDDAGGLAGAFEDVVDGVVDALNATGGGSVLSQVNECNRFGRSKYTCVLADLNKTLVSRLRSSAALPRR